MRLRIVRPHFPNELTSPRWPVLGGLLQLGHEPLGRAKLRLLLNRGVQAERRQAADPSGALDLGQKPAPGVVLGAFGEAAQLRQSTAIRGLAAGRLAVHLTSGPGWGQLRGADRTQHSLSVPNPS